MLRARRGGRGVQSSGPRAAQERAYTRMSSYGAGIGSSGLPSAIDEQLSPAGRPAKRSMIQSIELGSQSSGLPSAIDEQLSRAGLPAKRSMIQSIELGSQSRRLEMWLRSLYSS